MLLSNNPTTTRNYNSRHTPLIHDALPILTCGSEPPIVHASSARRTCCASASASEYTATVAMPSRRAVRITRHAISPRMAMRIFSNMRVSALKPSPSRGGLGGDGSRPVSQRSQDHFQHSFTVLRSEEHTSELKSLMRITNAVLCLNKKKK